MDHTEIPDEGLIQALFMNYEVVDRLVSKNESMFQPHYSIGSPNISYTVKLKNGNYRKRKFQDDTTVELDGMYLGKKGDLIIKMRSPKLATGRPWAPEIAHVELKLADALREFPAMKDELFNMLPKKAQLAVSSNAARIKEVMRREKQREMAERYPQGGDW